MYTKQKNKPKKNYLKFLGLFVFGNAILKVKVRGNKNIYNIFINMNSGN